MAYSPNPTPKFKPLAFDIDEAMRLKAKALGVEFAETRELWVEANRENPHISESLKARISNGNPS